ncbi:cell death regulator Aven [Numida meleagris]|uniref:cell death regulator Aven n=1 Tax=Numida meleagris TaxID=8996 RepID=UPI000B3DE2E5|nr:cell death regulator Aven [Numida meleagris]XP_021258859.1 cell death regulator Aven [Numida meleagris]XP_021258860.1 cell death regulator Aven [Numida meleagris]XP_021258861.1 cell death regulator Aven [Numida meleagris]XP_021258862.1 cell death regulator Aven [Numida meleagris]XP_021258863.1 cell death regulator Aven [Numida meleagris]XP_021258864.1 cell death regulator Aven [Numida meleagris]XP_021258865.1 cell death regulator Aven [Numida meleagris]XP_021258866.1 cell death regulator
MQPERGGGGSRPRPSRHSRRRPSGAEKAAEPATEGSGADGHRRGGTGGRGRGGAHGHRGGGGREKREPRGRRAAPPPAEHHHRRVEDDGDNESREEEEKEEVKNYSRRKIVSNWNRYEDAEKEGQRECGESQRGTDFSVLLSSAGDSFTQFRFAEEKDWDTENVYCKQLSTLSVDCQSLAQALQELPLHLRLNVAAELVQASTPIELPQMKSKVVEDNKRRELFQQSLPQREMAFVSQPVGHSVASSEPGTKHGPVTSAAEPFQRAHLLPKQETDHLDEELDRLLNLDAPIDSVSGALPYNISTEKDLKMESKENDPPRADLPEEKSAAPQQEQNTSKIVTEEELEDWLDSMIS